MIRYHVRSKNLIDIVNDVKDKKLIMSPYFQRNLVWRSLHKQDFIETILLGLPFPQIFIAQGDIDFDTMTSKKCIVDGQQRTNSIVEFCNNHFSVNNKFFKDFSESEKETFLNYQVPVIDLDMKASDPAIIDVFRRLNRTFYALSSIEKMATEYATVDLMLVAKHLAGLLDITAEEEEDEQVGLEEHPFRPSDFIEWSVQASVAGYQAAIFNNDIFKEQEIARLVHLLYTLNLLCTISFGFYNRNEKVKETLDDPEQRWQKNYKFIDTINRASEVLQKSGALKHRFWASKSNSFSLLVIACWNLSDIERMNSDLLLEKLTHFAAHPDSEYVLAAREAVNNRKQRITRHEAIAAALGFDLGEAPLVRN